MLNFSAMASSEAEIINVLNNSLFWHLVKKSELTATS